jgi:hypothetical protein
MGVEKEGRKWGGKVRRGEREEGEARCREGRM